MTMTRRRVLMAIAMVVGLADAIFLVWRQRDDTILVPITYVGVDSLIMQVPAKFEGATLQRGQWSPAVSDAQIPTEDMAGNRRFLTLVTLAPQAPYGNFLEAIKELRARKKCNIVVRGKSENIASPGPSEDLEASALVLCGNSIGDAGFSGVLPTDGVVRLIRRHE